MPETPEQIVEGTLRGIVEHPQMHALSFEALEATLHALLTVLLELREDEQRPVIALRKIAAQHFGHGSPLPLSRRLVEAHGPDIYSPSHPKHAEALGLYTRWVEKFLGADGTEERPFEPNWASAPGDTVRERIEHLGISVGQFAERVDLAPEEAVRLLEGDLPIHSDLAARLAELLGGSQTFWENRERQFLESLERLGRTRAGHVTRERDKERLHALLVRATNAGGDEMFRNVVHADALGIIDELHDELERLREIGKASS